MVKRVIDIGISLFVLLLASPVILMIYCIIHQKDGSPCFWKEARTGRGNRLFTMWQFRTTTIPSRVIRALPPYPFPRSWSDGVPVSFTVKLHEGARVTRTGAFLRAWSLEKLPQFFNVLKGDMSLVGPQPELPLIADHYSNLQQKRLTVRPGMTGYAQISGYNDHEVHGRKIAYDLYYIHHFSFCYDFIILYHAILHTNSRKK